jgi:hypothetical protein
MMPKLNALTLNRLLTAIVFIAIFTMAVRVLADTDTWWHLQSGRWIIENGTVPRNDPFSHTKLGEPWIDHGWLAQAVIYLSFDAFGYAGPVLFVAAMVTLAFYFIWLQCRDGDPWLRAFVFVIAAVTSGGIWAARPQIVSFALAGLVTYLLYRYKRGSDRAGWLLPLTVVLWVNIHGGFAIAFILMVAYLFGELGNQILGIETGIGWRRIGRLLLMMGLSFLLVPLNPNTFQMWAYPFQTVGIGVLQDFIAEWRPPNFHELHFHPFIWLLLAALTVLGLSKKRADFVDLTLVALFTYMTLLAARNIALFALVTAPVIVRYGTPVVADWQERVLKWEPEGQRPNEEKRSLFLIVNWLLLLLIMVVALIRISGPISAQANESEQTENLPVAAVDYLRENEPPGPLFNNYNWGGYIVWELPQYPVFVDGRTDLYGDELLREYLATVFANSGWGETLDKYDINLVFVESAAPLAEVLRQETGWEEVYRDEMASILVREGVDG